MSVGLCADQLDEVFPFHLVFDADLRVVACGRSLSRLCPDITPGASLPSCVRFRRPPVEMRADAIRARVGALFVLDVPASGAVLRGQVLDLGDGSCLFVGSPFLARPDDLQRFGLRTADFALHDPSLEFVQLAQAQLAALEDSTRLAESLIRQRAELRVAKQAAEEAAAQMGRFLANMSHEIRTPLNAVLGFTELLARTSLAPDQRELVLESRAAGKALLGIVNDILDYSKIEAGRMEMERVDLSPATLVDDVGQRFAAELGSRDLLLFLAVHPDTPRVVQGDPTRLAQILGNLVSNAIKFTQAGRVVLRVAPVVAAEGTVTLRFEVEDTGVGVPEGAAKRLFQPFAQADSTTTRRFGGSGLGLVISRRLARAMGGDVDFRSTPGAGATFWLEVPLAVPAVSAPMPRVEGVSAAIADRDGMRRALLAEALAAWGARVSTVAEGGGWVTVAAGGRREVVRLGKVVSVVRILAAAVPALNGQARRFAEPSGVPAARGERPRLLVADDNVANRRLLSGFLGVLGCDAELVPDGVSAVEAARRGGFDAILLDWHMPGMDGLEVAAAIRGEERGGRRVPIVAVTASALPGDREACLSAGMDDFVAKPVQLADLARVLGRFLRSLRPPTQRPPPAPVKTAPPVKPSAPPRIAAPAASPLSDLRTTPDGARLADELIDLYLGEAPTILDRLGEALSRGAARDVMRLAHTLKGSSANVSAPAVRAACELIEAEAAAGRLDGLEVALARARRGLVVDGERLRAERGTCTA